MYMYVVCSNILVSLFIQKMLLQCYYKITYNISVNKYENKKGQNNIYIVHLLLISVFSLQKVILFIMRLYDSKNSSNSDAKE